jgi:hypothetical protein
LDGEATPADVMAVLEHLPGCASCRQFARDVGELQHLVDDLPVAPGSTESIEAQAHDLGPALLLRDANAEALGDNAVTGAVHTATSSSRRIVSMERAPRWVWALAACLLVALGFGLGDRMSSAAALGPVDADGELVVQLGADAGHMTEERFVALTLELLRADRRYRDKMSQVLDEVAERRSREGSDGELAHWEGDETSMRREESGSAAMGEMLSVTPMKQVY